MKPVTITDELSFIKYCHLLYFESKIYLTHQFSVHFNLIIRIVEIYISLNVVYDIVRTKLYVTHNIISSSE